MSNATTDKKYSGFIQVPYEFFQEREGRVSGRVETLLRGIIYGFSTSSNTCRFSYSAFEQYIHRSRATIASAVGDIREKSSDVKITRKGGQASEYQYVGVCKKAHVRVPVFLFYEIFDMPNGKGGSVNRLLTLTELLVYTLILTHSLKNKRTGVFEGSEISIAKMINCSPRSVSRAIYTLMKGDMISRPVKGKNRYSAKSQYRANIGLYNMLWRKHNPITKKKEIQEQVLSKGVPQKGYTDADISARAERDRYYAHVRELSQRIVDRNYKKANSVPGFIDVGKERRTLDIAIARAEVQNSEILSTLRERERTLTFEYERLLRSVELTPSDMMIRYRCRKCEDTGYKKKDGMMCTCYTPPSKGDL